LTERLGPNQGKLFSCLKREGAAIIVLKGSGNLGLLILDQPLNKGALAGDVPLVFDSRFCLIEKVSTLFF
jgi:hypothetical protein